MANLRRPFSKEKDNIVVGRVKPNGRCKKHPKHHQSPGVCSLCLREKLTQLSSSISSRRIPTSSTTACSSTSSSLSSYYSSCSSSSCASPMHGRFRFATEGKSGSNSVPFFMMSGKQGIIKSRSMIFGPIRRRDHREGGVDHVNKSSANKSGFWLKLLHPKSKRMEDLRLSEKL
ncbi:hypothetical protein RIF29_16920 [Crotalaria pallida]|uniref:Uncharacterized protein n=1 Tax=Crotalaria pallida TaxID=3830 RepID=A0AAN9FI88_CROPI